MLTGLDAATVVYILITAGFILMSVADIIRAWNLKSFVSKTTFLVFITANVLLVAYLVHLTSQVV